MVRVIRLEQSECSPDKRLAKFTITHVAHVRQPRGNELWLNNNGMKYRSNWRVRLSHALKAPISNFNKDHSIKEYIIALSQKLNN